MQEEVDIEFSFLSTAIIAIYHNGRYHPKKHQTTASNPPRPFFQAPLIAPLSPDIVKRLVRRVEDTEHHASRHIGRYRQRALRLLEDYMADHDQQLLLELNANKPSGVLIRVGSCVRYIYI